MFGGKKYILRDFKTYEEGLFHIIKNKGLPKLQEYVLTMSLPSLVFPSGYDILYVPSFHYSIWEEKYGREQRGIQRAMMEFLEGYKRELVLNLQTDWNEIEANLTPNLEDMQHQFDAYFLKATQYELLTKLFGIELRSVMDLLQNLVSHLQRDIRRKVERSGRAFDTWMQDLKRELSEREREQDRKRAREESVKRRIKGVQQERSARYCGLCGAEKEDEVCQYCGEVFDLPLSYIPLLHKGDVKIKPKKHHDWKFWDRKFKDHDPDTISLKDVTVRRFLPKNVVDLSSIRKYYDDHVSNFPLLEEYSFQELQNVYYKGTIQFKDLHIWEEEFIFKKRVFSEPEVEERYKTEKLRLILRLHNDRVRLYNEVLRSAKRMTRRMFREFNREIEPEVRL